MAPTRLLALWLVLLSLALPLASRAPTSTSNRQDESSITFPSGPPGRTMESGSNGDQPLSRTATSPASPPAGVVVTSGPLNIGTPAPRRQVPASEMDDPPRELLPTPPMDVPRLISAGHESLHFVLEIASTENCPNIVVWYYKVELEEWTEQTATVKKMESQDFCNAELTIQKLKMSTTYLVKAKPTTLKNDSIKNWYSTLPTAPFTQTVSGFTCPAEVAPVEDLRVHAAGKKWLALSWRPPTSPCLTQLEYEVAVKAVMDYNKFKFQQKGSFWSNASWVVKNPAMSCTSWPDRHCLLIQEDSKSKPLDPNQEYQIKMKVKRIEGEKYSDVKTILATTTDMEPGLPEDLCCVRPQPTRLELRWRRPLSSGGVLSVANVSVELRGQMVYNVSLKITSLNHSCTHVVEGLQATEFYDVSVRFGTRTGKVGEAAHIKVWTTPPKEDGSLSEVCKGRGFEHPASPAAHSGLGSDDADGTLPWVLWSCITLVLLALVAAVAFIGGRRCRSQKLWFLAPQKDPNYAGVGSGASSSGDEASLCGPAVTQPSGTPPSCALDYAEVDLSSGRAWTAAPRPPHDYEVLRGAGSSSNNAHLAEQPYSVVRDATEPPSPCYAEMARPRLRAPPVASNPMPVYAQVDKKRAPPLPPTGPRLALQDSD